MLRILGTSDPITPKSHSSGLEPSSPEKNAAEIFEKVGAVQQNLDDQ